MNRQTTLSDMEYGNRRKKTRREKFLETMDAIIPWERLSALIEPHYYHSKMGRPPIGIETMLRMYLLQIWFALSDEQTEEGIYDSRAMHDFMRMNFLTQQAPDATTLMQFRHLLERAGLQQQIHVEIVALLESKGLIMHGGTIVDATIIQAPSSTHNSSGKRDPEMKSTKKGNNFHFGMKAHTGVDAGSGAVMSTSYTGANEQDITEAHKHFRKDDSSRYGDSAFTGVDSRPEIQAMDEGKEVAYHISRRLSRRTERHSYPLNWERQIEAQKAARRCIVEYPFLIVKRIFGCNRAIYRGIVKNGCRLDMAFACANLFMFRHRLLPLST